MEKEYTNRKVATFQQRFSEICDSNPNNASFIAEQLHVSRQTVSAWKSGYRSPKAPTIVAIADYFGITIEWLMGFDCVKEAKKPDIPVFLPNNEKFTKIMANMTAQEYETVVRIFEKAYERIKEKGESI